jgi:dipeptidyl aminopeptidase/acylaminoacyl peptidase
MNRTPCLRLLLAVGLLAQTLPAAEKFDLERETPVPADQPIPTQDFFRQPLLSEPELNHAGTHIAAIVSSGDDKQLLLVFEIATGKVNSLGSSQEKDIYNLNWLGDSRVLFQIDSRKMYGLGIMAADIKDLSSAYPVQQYNSSRLISIPLKNQLHPLLWNRYDMENRRDNGVVEVDTSRQSGKFVDLTAATGDYDMQVHVARENNRRSTVRSFPPAGENGTVYGYMADKTGELAYGFTSVNGELSMLRLEGGKWLRCPVDLEQIDIIGNANAPGELLVLGPWLDGKPRPLQLMNAATGQLGDVVLQDQNYDFNGRTYRNPATGDLLGVIFQKGGPRAYWFNEEYKTLQKILDGMFPGLVTRIYGSDDHHKIFLVATFSDKQPSVYHWVNLETRKAGIFKSSRPWIDPARMQAMQILPFKTRDGYRLDSYLTLPAGASKTNPAPLVVLCHGGPWARDHWGFESEVQFLAHHGYAVLQPNYRGSTGSVGRFPMGDEYEFVKMHHDVTDSVKAALATGLVDAGRVGIMGGSFGGYLSVSGVAHEPDLYRCAVTNAGVFDWSLQVLSGKRDQYDRPHYRRLVKVLGDPKKEKAKYDAMSPINFVKNIRVPVFVAGGRDDQTVEIQQSRNLISELDAHHIRYEKFFVSGEGHGMAFVKNEVEYHDRVLAFLDANLKPKK